MQGQQGQPQVKRHTIYDQLEAAGVFDLNPANASARNYKTGEVLYKGPVEFPKMLFHPKGEMRQIVPPNYIVNPVKGPIETDSQWELIYAIAEDAEAEQKLLDTGWHNTPEAANAVRENRPAKRTALEKAKDVEAENKRLLAALEGLQKENQELQTKALAPQTPLTPAKPNGTVTKNS